MNLYQVCRKFTFKNKQKTTHPSGKSTKNIASVLLALIYLTKDKLTMLAKIKEFMMKKRTLLQCVVLQSRIWTYKMLYKMEMEITLSVELTRFHFMYLWSDLSNIYFTKLITVNNGITPSADGLDLTMKGTLNVMFDYCSIPIGSYFKLGAQAGFLSNWEKSPYLCFCCPRLG